MRFKYLIEKTGSVFLIMLFPSLIAVLVDMQINVIEVQQTNIKFMKTLVTI